MADESQSPIMAALMQVGAATEAQIASSGAALRDSLAGTNDALRQIINENYKVFEERTAELGEQHATLKQAGDENLSAVRAEISEAGAANAESFGAHQALITELGSKLEALQGELSAEKAERVAAEESTAKQAKAAADEAKAARAALGESVQARLDALQETMAANQAASTAELQRAEESLAARVAEQVAAVDAKVDGVAGRMDASHQRLDEAVQAARDEAASAIAEENEVWSGHVRTIKAAQSQAARDSLEARAALHQALEASLASQRDDTAAAIKAEAAQRAEEGEALARQLQEATDAHAAHLQEFQDAVATAQVSSREERAGLSSELQELQTTTAARFDETVAVQAEIKAAQAAAVSNMEADMQRKYEDMRDRHDNSNAKFTELIVEANEGMQSIVQRLESSSSEARVQVEAVQATLEEQHMALEQKLDVEIGKLTAAGQEAQEKLEETVRSECEALSADIDNACEDYQNLIAEVRRQLEIKFTETEIKIVGAEQKNASATSDTAAQLDAHSTQLNFLKNSLKTVEADGAKRRDELKTIVQGLIVANKGEQESRLETVDREMESIKAQLDTIQETLRTELQLTKASTEQKLESIMSATQRNLLGLKEDQAAQATAIESAKSKLESRLESLKNVHESTSQHLSNLAGKRNWVNDKEVDNCQCCDRRFSLTVRKHHCRMCGSIVCYNCSKWRRKIPGQTRLQRVCDSCIRNRSPSAADSDQFSQDLTGRDRESTDVLAGNGGAGDAGGGGGGGGDAEGDAAGVPTARLDLSS